MTGRDSVSMGVVIVGGGIAGLSAAYRLTQAGHKVTLFEKETELGGLARSFKLGNQYLERYYHFICLNDEPLLDLIGELGLSPQLHWVYTGMGQFFERVLYSFGEPWDLLLFRPFSFIERLRFGFNIMNVKSQSADGWRALENVPAPEWLVRTFGPRAYQVVHQPLIQLKFGEYMHRLSASWIWARFHRLGKSRTKWTQRERLGYLDGGMHALISTLAERIEQAGGEIHTGVTVDRLVIENGATRGVIVDGKTILADSVVSTIPSAALRRIANDPDDEYFHILKNIDYIGVMCALLRLKRPLSRFFWTNISDPDIPLAGVIEYTNLHPCPALDGDRIVYLPLYLPATSERYAVDDRELLHEYICYLKTVWPDFDESWIQEWFVFRDEYAQPICEVGFTQYLPPIVSSLPGLFVTDSSQLHPEDRTVSNSINLGRQAANLVQAHVTSGRPGAK
jgi:protoporphyrinogen oxidase